MEPLRTDFRDADKIFASEWNKTNRAINELAARPAGMTTAERQQLNQATQATQINATKIEQLFGLSILEHYTLAEYLDMRKQGTLQNCFYAVYKNEALYRLYLGTTLIMKKAESGEKVTVGGVYPLVFPIIFG